MFQQHIQYILDKNIEALLDQYTDDCLLDQQLHEDAAVLPRPRGTARAHAGHPRHPGLEDEIVFWAETENPETLMITEKITMKLADGEAKMRFADSWVLRDGKIAIHFAGMVQHPDGSLA